MASVKETGQRVQTALNELSKLFVPGMQLTFIARLPGNDGADFVVTNDDPHELIKVCDRILMKKAVTKDL